MSLITAPTTAHLVAANGFKILRSVETHCGAHCRVVFGGSGELDIPGETMFEKKVYLERHADWLRTLLLKEPRGAFTSNVDLILPSPDPRADVGFVIMEQTPYYPPMSGGNLICVVTALLETGVIQMVEPETTLTLETPAGLVTARAGCQGGRVTSVAFTNVPAFATHLDTQIEVPGIGPVTVDIAYGGMFYVMVEAAAVGLRIEPAFAAELVAVGEQIKRAAREQLHVVHPENPGINYLESLLWYGPPKDPGNHARNTVVMSIAVGRPDSPQAIGGLIDRSPCGTGTSARAAVLHAKGQLAIGEEFRHEGILDIAWTGRVVDTVDLNGVAAVTPEVTGRGWVTGVTEHIVHDDDPFPAGFVLPDR